MKEDQNNVDFNTEYSLCALSNSRWQHCMFTAPGWFYIGLRTQHWLLVLIWFYVNNLLPLSVCSISTGKSSRSSRLVHRWDGVDCPSGLLFFHSTSIFSFCMVTSFSAAWMSSRSCELRSKKMATCFHSFPSRLATCSSCRSDMSWPWVLTCLPPSARGRICTSQSVFHSLISCISRSSFTMGQFTWLVLWSLPFTVYLFFWWTAASLPACWCIHVCYTHLRQIWLRTKRTYWLSSFVAFFLYPHSHLEEYRSICTWANRWL